MSSEAPTPHPISACGTYGSLTFPDTTGVSYKLTEGDGKQELYVVTASAQNGYRLSQASVRRFSGSLGQYEPCPESPRIGAIAKSPQGDPTTDPWEITISPSLFDQESHTVDVTYRFDSGVIVKSRQGIGWTCREPGGGEIGAGDEYFFPDPDTAFTCSFDYSGTPPAPVTLVVLGVDSSFQTVTPTGSVTLSSDGGMKDEDTF